MTRRQRILALGDVDPPGPAQRARRHIDQGALEVRPVLRALRVADGLDAKDELLLAAWPLVGCTLHGPGRELVDAVDRRLVAASLRLRGRLRGLVAFLRAGGVADSVGPRRHRLLPVSAALDALPPFAVARAAALRREGLATEVAGLVLERHQAAAWVRIGRYSRSKVGVEIAASRPS